MNIIIVVVVVVVIIITLSQTRISSAAGINMLPQDFE